MRIEQRKRRKEIAPPPPSNTINTAHQALAIASPIPIAISLSLPPPPPPNKKMYWFWIRIERMGHGMSCRYLTHSKRFRFAKKNDDNQSHKNSISQSHSGVAAVNFTASWQAKQAHCDTFFAYPGGGSKTMHDLCGVEQKLAKSGCN